MLIDDMKIYNTLSKKIDEFEPLKGSVSYYTCGPTVYDHAHIGNLRTYIFEDILKRTLMTAGFDVYHVMNITDVDDKTIKKGQGNKSKHTELTQKYQKIFFEDLAKLNILPPTKITRATQYIEQMVELVDSLLNKGYAYKGDDGSIYFSIDKYADYGKLSNLDKSGLKSGARVSQDEYNKENPADFALWKAWDQNDGEIYWETSLGKGRPGWHIECSAMSQKELGQTIDIHAGGVDLIFPHHENEIAQSEAATGKQFAKYWVHGEHLLVEGKKMSKSLNNFYTLDDIVGKGFSPLDFRYLCLQAHYRSKLNFTWEGMEAAKNSRLRLQRIAQEIENKAQSTNRSQTLDSKYLSQFKEKIFDDLNTPEALAVVWEMVRDTEAKDDEKYAAIQYLDKEILALGLLESGVESIPQDILALAELRSKAKIEKNFAKADRIREEIEIKGYTLEDTVTGTKIIKK
ncbi:MAG: Cysteine--tRNA ligase [bacterium ADurb.Bin212]|nr:MAG: Cysteine--tRNA ligase [bacterium ADurb.Bin212]